MLELNDLIRLFDYAALLISKTQLTLKNKCLIVYPPETDEAFKAKLNEELVAVCEKHGVGLAARLYDKEEIESFDKQREKVDKA